MARAAIGTTVKLYVDLVARVATGDVIETGTGRRYGVIGVHVQRRGKHEGRQHLTCLVLDPGTPPRLRPDNTPGVVHGIRWYHRGRGKDKRAHQ